MADHSSCLVVAGVNSKIIESGDEDEDDEDENEEEEEEEEEEMMR